MTTKQVMAQLERAGTAQNRKVYTRHGVHGEMYGVSFAELRKLGKKLKTDHRLALGLWESGNHDARVLATLVADPTALGKRELDGWARDCDNYVVTDSFSGLASRSPHARDRVRKWTAAKDEWVGQAGWNVLAYLALSDLELPDGWLEDYLPVIEREIHDGKNRVRYAMNNALIAIGSRNERLRGQAVAVAKRIGRVDVDHGETSCKTPDAASYIRKMVERKKSRGEWS